MTRKIEFSYLDEFGNKINDCFVDDTEKALTDLDRYILRLYGKESNEIHRTDSHPDQVASCNRR